MQQTIQMQSNYKSVNKPSFLNQQQKVINVEGLQKCNHSSKYNNNQSNKVSICTNSPKFPQQLEIKKCKRGKIHKKSAISRGFLCLKQLIKKLCPKNQQNCMVVNQQNLLQVIQSIRQNDNKNIRTVLPALKQNKKTIVLEIQGTLIYSHRHKINGYAFKSKIDCQGTQVEIFSKVRPGLDNFLVQINKLYEIVVFTNNHKTVADTIIDHIDKKKLIVHRLYRNNCLNLNKIYYLKDLRKLNRNLSQVVFIDFNVATGVLQPLNFYQIPRFTGDKNDNQLQKLRKFLQWLSVKNQVTPIFKNLQIFNKTFPVKTSRKNQKKQNLDKLIKVQDQNSQSNMKSKQYQQQIEQQIDTTNQNKQLKIEQLQQNLSIKYQTTHHNMKNQPVLTQQNLAQQKLAQQQNISNSKVNENQISTRIILHQPNVVQLYQQQQKNLQYQGLLQKIKQINKKHKRHHSQIIMENILNKVRDQQFGKSNKILETVS